MDDLFERIRTSRHLRRRAGRAVRHRAERRRDCALGPGGQGARPAGLPAARRQDAGPHPRLLRLADRRPGRPEGEAEDRAGHPRLGFTAVKIDIDDATDPQPLGPGELDRQQRRDRPHGATRSRFVRESLAEAHRPRRRHARALRHHDRQARGQGARTVQAAVARGAGARPRTWTRCARSGESTTTPICCGENLFLRHGFREVLEKRAADIIMPDMQKCGGLLETRKIADMAHTYYVPVAPHCVVSPIGYHGLVPRLRGGAELPRPGVALDPAARTCGESS